MFWISFYIFCGKPELTQQYGEKGRVSGRKRKALNAGTRAPRSLLTFEKKAWLKARRTALTAHLLRFDVLMGQPVTPSTSTSPNHTL